MQNFVLDFEYISNHFGELPTYPVPDLRTENVFVSYKDGNILVSTNSREIDNSLDDLCCTVIYSENGSSLEFNVNWSIQTYSRDRPIKYLKKKQNEILDLNTCKELSANQIYTWDEFRRQDSFDFVKHARIRKFCLDMKHDNLRRGFLNQEGGISVTATVGIGERLVFYDWEHGKIVWQLSVLDQTVTDRVKWYLVGEKIYSGDVNIPFATNKGRFQSGVHGGTIYIF